MLFLAKSVDNLDLKKYQRIFPAMKLPCPYTAYCTFS